MEPTSNNNIKQGLLGGLAIVLVGTLAFFLSKNKDVAVQETPNPVTPTNTTNTTPQPATPANTSEKKTVYRDGTYTADGTYTSPGGSDKISITITLANDIITAASFSGSPSNPVSEKLQAAFNSGYTTQVVGKPIEGLSLAVVNGASLTTKSFSQTLDIVRAQAKN